MADEFEGLVFRLGLTDEVTFLVTGVGREELRALIADRAAVPDAAAAAVADLDRFYEQRSRDCLAAHLKRANRAKRPPPAWPLLRYRSEDIPAFLPGMARLGAGAHAALLDRIRLAFVEAGVASVPPLVWFEPERYQNWLGKRADTEARRIQWASAQLARANRP